MKYDAWFPFVIPSSSELSSKPCSILDSLNDARARGSTRFGSLVVYWQATWQPYWWLNSHWSFFLRGVLCSTAPFSPSLHTVATKTYFFLPGLVETSQVRWKAIARNWEGQFDYKSNKKPFIFEIQWICKAIWKLTLHLSVLEHVVLESIWIWMFSVTMCVDAVYQITYLSISPVCFLSSFLTSLAFLKRIQNKIHCGFYFFSSSIFIGN